jgi:toxin ParE1/3/4
MYKVELLPTAWDDLQEIFDYISINSPKSAENTLRKIIGSLRRLEQFPNSGVYTPDHELKKYGFRMIIATPYISFYRLIDNIVFIYHIIHGAKNYSDLLKSYIQEDGQI